MKKRLGEIGRGRLIGPSEERVTFDDLANALVTEYQINAKRSVRSVQLSIVHLERSLGPLRAVDITTDRIKAHVLERQKEGAANASINRELSALKRMFSLAVRSGKLSQGPFIPMLQEDNARQGFLDHGGFLSLRDALPDYLKDPIGFLYYSGWRLGEMKSLEWRDVDLEGHVIRLRPENSKNRESRTLPLSGELAEVIGRAEDRRRLDCSFVFHRDGKPVGDFRKAWDDACKAAGLQRLLVHDLRRTAARNMIRAGIPERIAMKMTGHKTRSIFDRYNIVTEQDLQDASKRLQAHLADQPQTQKVVPLVR